MYKVLCKLKFQITAAYFNIKFKNMNRSIKELLCAIVEIINAFCRIREHVFHYIA